MAWEPGYAFSLAVGLLSFVLAAVLLAAAQERRGRAVAFVLIFEGFTTLAAVAAAASQPCATGCGAVGTALHRASFIAPYWGVMAVGWLVLFILGTLDSPLSRWLRRPAVEWSIVGLSLASLVQILALWFRHPQDPFSGLPAVFLAMPLVNVWVAVLVAPVLAIAASVDAWRRAPAGDGRRQNGAYALAFGIRDGAILVGLVVLGVGTADVARFMAYAVPVIVLLYATTLTYAVLRFGVLDVKKPARFAIRQGTVITGLALVFFVLSEVLENALGGASGWVAAGVVALLLWPAERGARTLIARVLPTAPKDRPATIYLDAAAGAFADAEVSPAERAMLDRLAASLKLSSKEQTALETKLRANSVAS